MLSLAVTCHLMRLIILMTRYNTAHFSISTFLKPITIGATARRFTVMLRHRIYIITLHSLPLWFYVNPIRRYFMLLPKNCCAAMTEAAIGFQLPEVLLLL